MSARLYSDTSLVDGSPTSRLLTELGDLYRLVIACDAAGKIRWMSEGWDRICAHPDSFVGSNLRGVMPSLLHPEQLFTIRRHGRAGGILADLHLDVVGAEGTVWPLNLAIAPLYTPSEEQPLFAVIAQLASECDKRPDEEAGSILASLTDAVLAVDEGGLLRYANPAAGTLLGIEPRDLPGRPVVLIPDRTCDARRLISCLPSR